MSGAVTYLDGYAEVHGYARPAPPSSNYGLTLTYVLKQKYIFQLFGNHRVDAFTQSAYLFSRPSGAHLPDVELGLYVLLRGAGPSCRCVSANGSRRASRFPDSITCCATAISTAWTTNVRNGWGYAALDNTLRLSRKPDLAFEFGGYYQSEAIQCTLRHRRFVAPRRRG